MRSATRTARIALEQPQAPHAREFLAAVRASRDLHHPWVAPPATPRAFHAWLARIARGEHHAHLVLDAERCLAGVISLNGVQRGNPRSAQLGFYAFHGSNGRGLMRAGLRAVLRRAFREYRLQRLEASIQPDNHASRRLVEGMGFECEGLSPRFLKIAGRWRDHERWALRAEQWRAGANAWR